MIHATDMHHGASLLAPTIPRAALYISRTVVHGILLPQPSALLSCCEIVSINNGPHTAFLGLFHVLGSQLDLDIDLFFFRLLP